jgi:ribonuclease HI
MAKSKWYAVANGRSGSGIYRTWDECKAQTAGFSGAIFKSFKTHDDAQAFIRSNPATAPTFAFAPSKNVKGKKRTRDVNDTSRGSQPKRSSQRYETLINNGARVHITIHFDGGSRGNPGVAGGGSEVVVVNNTMRPPITTKYFIREFCGNMETNNYAEYQGLIAGLKQVRAVITALVSSSSSPPSAFSSTSKSFFQLQVYGDSNLIIQQLRGNWQCKNDNIKPLYHQCQHLISQIKSIDSNSDVSLNHVYREQNKVADQLANEAMDQRRSWMTVENNTQNNAGTVKVGVVKTSCYTVSAAQTNIAEIDVNNDGSDYSC